MPDVTCPECETTFYVHPDDAADEMECRTCDNVFGPKTPKEIGVVGVDADERNRPGLSKRTIWIIAGLGVLLPLLGVLLTLVFVKTGRHSSKQHPELSGLQEALGAPVAEFDAVSLMAEWKSNQAKIEKAYFGKTIGVQGVFGSVQKRSEKETYFLFFQDRFGTSYEIQCEFSGSDQLAALQHGQPVSLIGHCKGIEISTLTLTGCRIRPPAR